MLTLIIMRHAKSSWKTGHSDHERPLNGRGRRQGYAGGQWIVENHPQIDHVVCSTSKRTRQTLERVQDAGVEPGAISFHREIYEAAVDDLVAVLRGTPPQAQTVLLIGHYPGVEILVEELSGQTMDDHFVTSGIATLTFDGEWSNVGHGRLVSFVAPGRD